MGTMHLDHDVPGPTSESCQATASSCDVLSEPL